MFNFLPTDFTLTLVIFYWAYLLVVGIFLIMSVLNIYTLLRFGFFSLINIGMVVIYIGVSVWLIWYSLNVLGAVDWSLPIFDANWFSGGSGLFGG
jgi:hypothetical protein